MENKEGKKIFEIPNEGSLGLLALGDIGLKLWREKRGDIKVPEEKVEKKDKK